MREALTHAKLFMVDRPLDPVLEVTQFISEWIKRHRSYPTFQFNNIRGGAPFRLIMNLLKRDVLLRRMNVSSSACLATFAQRLTRNGSVVRGVGSTTHALPDLGHLPALHHQPRDKGRYLTSFVGCLQSPQSGAYNLGFYRAFVHDNHRLAIFMDARTDGHRIMTAGLERGESVPITLFNGGPLGCYLAAAAKLPGDLDSFEAAARLEDRALCIDQTNFPPAPVNSEIVIRGVINGDHLPEAPFGEFKGYYCAPTSSPVVHVEQIKVRDDPYYLGLFCGKESGLTLMSLQNEILLFAHLQECGFEVGTVQYPLQAHGEFLTLIETPGPSIELLRAAMEFDQRSKLFVVAERLDDVLSELAIFPFESVRVPYVKRGRHEGDRVGVVCKRSTPYEWVEY